MKTTVDQSLYSNPDMIDGVVELFKKEMGSFDEVKSYSVNVLDFDDSRDLTDIPPRERNNISVHTFSLFESIEEKILSKFPLTVDYIKLMPGVIDARMIAIGPNSILPLHLDDMGRPSYDLNDWYSVFIGIQVPSENSDLLGVQIETDICKHKSGLAIIFDTQIPHHAWNNTSEWWISLRLSILKNQFGQHL